VGAAGPRSNEMPGATTLRTPLGRRVKVVERGTGTPVVFLHSGVGSAGEWKQVFSLWPEGYQLVAIEAYRDGTGPGVAGRRSLDDYADHVYAVAARDPRHPLWTTRSATSSGGTCRTHSTR
jgi:lipase